MTDSSESAVERLAKGLQWSADMGKATADNANYQCGVSIAEAEQAAATLRSLRAELSKASYLARRASWYLATDATPSEYDSNLHQSRIYKAITELCGPSLSEKGETLYGSDATIDKARQV